MIKLKNFKITGQTYWDGFNYYSIVDLDTNEKYYCRVYEKLYYKLDVFQCQYKDMYIYMYVVDGVKNLGTLLEYENQCKIVEKLFNLGWVLTESIDYLVDTHFYTEDCLDNFTVAYAEKHKWFIDIKQIGKQTAIWLKNQFYEWQKEGVIE